MWFLCGLAVYGVLWGVYCVVSVGIINGGLLWTNEKKTTQGPSCLELKNIFLLSPLFTPPLHCCSCEAVALRAAWERAPFGAWQHAAGA